MLRRKSKTLELGTRVTVDGVPGKVVRHTETGQPLIALSQGFYKGIPSLHEGARIRRAG